MPYAKVTLFDVNDKGDMAGPPVVCEASFEYRIDTAHQKVTITVADDQMACAGTIVMPMQILGQLVEQAMQERAKHARIIVPPKSGIIFN